MIPFVIIITSQLFSNLLFLTTWRGRDEGIHRLWFVHLISSVTLYSPFSSKEAEILVILVRETRWLFLWRWRGRQTLEEHMETHFSFKRDIITRIDSSIERLKEEIVLHVKVFK
jgi:hypothetical protein